MKKSNFWKLLSGTVFFATVALASCVDDNDDKGMPYLEVTPTCSRSMPTVPRKAPPHSP